MPTLTRVTFKVRAELDVGQNVRITGDPVSLGSFSPNRGMDLVTTPKEYPVWRTSRPVTLPRGVPVSYKYVIMSGGQFHGWEPISAHARTLIPEGWEMTVTDDIGMYEEPEAAALSFGVTDSNLNPIAARVSSMDAVETPPRTLGPVQTLPPPGTIPIPPPPPSLVKQQQVVDDLVERSSSVGSGNISDVLSATSGALPADSGFVDAHDFAAQAAAQVALEATKEPERESTRPVNIRSKGKGGSGRSGIHPHVRFDLSNTATFSVSPETIPSISETASADDNSASSNTSTTPLPSASSPRARPIGYTPTPTPDEAWPSPDTVHATLAHSATSALPGVMKLPTSAPPMPAPAPPSIHKYRMFLVSFNLPVNLYYRESGDSGHRWSAEWNPDSISRKSEGSVAYDHQVMWVGAITPYVIRNEDTEIVWRLTDADREEIREKLHAFDCVPIFLKREDFVDHYIRSCLMRFRDIFHNVLNVNLSREDMRRLNRSTKNPSKTATSTSSKAPVLDSDGKPMRGGAGSTSSYKRYTSASSTTSEGSSTDDVKTSRDRWEGFISTSNIFADVIMELILQDVTSRDLVWVHNFPLMLVPEILRARATASGLSRKMQPKIVFFLHTPFPTSEIFRTVSVRNELLEGMLGADVVGFHTFDHARHFITSCKRFLGLQFHSQKGGRLVVDHMDRAVLIAISHVGVERHLLDNAVLSRTGQEGAAAIRETHRGKSIIVAMDEMTRLQGVPLKLLAFERLLMECPRYRGKVVLIQHGLLMLNETLMSMADRTPADDENGEEVFANYNAERAVVEVKQLCERINRVYGPVVFYKEYTPNNWPGVEARAAIYGAADIMVCTPVMEGLNLRPLEYTFCHRDPAGVVIMSEFSAASRVLNGAIRVNCYDIKEVSQAMDQALCMTVEERNARRDRDCTYISNRSSAEWTRNILMDVELGVQGEIEALTHIDKDILQGSEYHSVVAFDNIVHEGYCHPLNPSEILQSYKRCDKRLILLDYAGTLTPRELGNLAVKRDFLGVSKRKLSPRVSDILRRLCRDKRNVVFVISGNRTHVLRSAFAEVLEDPSTPLGLVAHSGVMIRWGHLDLPEHTSGETVSAAVQASGASGDDDEVLDQITPPKDGADPDGWEYILPGVNKDWDSWMKAADVPSILEDYTWRTGGSAWNQTAVSASWQFRQADPEWGGMQAIKLENELKEAISAVNIPVVVGRKKHTVELLPKGVDKGQAVYHIVDEIKKHLDFVPQFCFCVGDDTSDEYMYTAVLDFLGSQNDVVPIDADSMNQRSSECGKFADAFTCTVGRKPTAAQFYVNETDGVVDVLDSFAKFSDSQEE